MQSKEILIVTDKCCSDVRTRNRVSKAFRMHSYQRVLDMSTSDAVRS